MAGSGRAGRGVDRILPWAARFKGTDHVRGRSAWRSGFQPASGHLARNRAPDYSRASMAWNRPGAGEISIRQMDSAVRATVTSGILRALAQRLPAVRGRAWGSNAAHFSMADRENLMGLRAGSAPKIGESGSALRIAGSDRSDSCAVSRGLRGIQFWR